LVFNEKGTQPGIPEHQNPSKVWKALEENGPQYLDRLGILLGYEQFSGSVRPGAKDKSGSAKDGTGPTSGGQRSAATWKARHSPLVLEIGAILRDLQWTRCDGNPWNPDIVVKSPNSNHVMLFEVKPDISTHNIITAIGQIICYRSPFKNVAGIIAAPNARVIGKQLQKILDRYDIRVIDLDNNVRTQLKALCEHVCAADGFR